MSGEGGRKEDVRVGERMPDGTVYAGISSSTGYAMYTTPGDAPLACTFNQARKYAKKLDAHGHKDWRVPTRNELIDLFENRAAIGGFNISGVGPASWYWSSSQIFHDAASARADLSIQEQRLIPALCPLNLNN
jgi:hypothetical protein